MLFSKDDKALLEREIKQLGITCQLAQLETLLNYLQLIVKWNRAYNLTAITAPRAMIIRHILDSLAILPYLRGDRVLDVGTGAGLPGIPLAIMQPSKAFVLLDSNGKKTRFLTQATFELALRNVIVVQARIEAYNCAEEFATIICRAFSSLPNIVTTMQPLCQQKGQILAMKGAYPDDELKQLSTSMKVAVKALQVPGLNEQRHLVIMEK